MKLKSIKYFLYLVFIMFITSCGLWNNFTTYFNRYYNAKNLFEEVEEEIAKNNIDIFAFKQNKISNQLKGKIKKLIEKTSNLLQFNRESSYFNDALLMTGKAFFYQGDFSKALRKFQELEALNDENLGIENSLWIGKTLLQLREFEQGIKKLDDLIDSADDDDIKKEAIVAEISFYTYRERYPEAIDLCNQLLVISDDDILNAKAAYQLGELNLKMNNLKEAAKAFAKVDDFSPDFITDFNSKFEIAKIYKNLGKFDESMNLLDSLKNENKFKDYWDTIEIEIGKIYYAENNIEDALSQYMKVDTLYSKKESSGVASFLIGQILANDFNDYDSAMTFLNRTIASKAPKEIKTEARNESSRLIKYLKLSKKLNKSLRQLGYLIDENIFFRDSLAYEDLVKKDSAKFKPKQKTAFKSKKSGSFNKKSFEKNKVKRPEKPKRPTISADSLKSLISNTEYELANTFFTELEVPDSAYYYYTKALEDNPLNTEKPQILYAIGNYYLIKGDTLKADSVFQDIYQNYKGNEIVNEVAKILNLPEVVSQTNDAEVLYLKAEQSLDDSNYTDAIRILKEITTEYPKSTYAAKSLYAIGWIYENQIFNPDSAEMYYDSLNTKFTNSNYAKKIKTKVYFYKKDQNEKQAKLDSIKLAEQALQSNSAETQKSVKGKTKKPDIEDESKK